MREAQNHPYRQSGAPRHRHPGESRDPFAVAFIRRQPGNSQIEMDPGFRRDDEQKGP